jgi:type III secretion protein J
MRPDNPYQAILRLVLFFSLFLLAACKVDLYTNMGEKEANEIMAILLSKGIECHKLKGEEFTFTLRVEEKDFARAVEGLKELGYPKDKFLGMGAIFKKEKLIASPLEERIRFIYALSQQISETLSHIDGVISARVHVVLPENNPFTEAKPSSAAVFIKYQQGSHIDSLVPDIKKMVINSIEGLTYEKVSVVLFPSELPAEATTKKEYHSYLGLEMKSESAVFIRNLFGISILLLFLAGGVIGFLYWNSRRKR